MPTPREILEETRLSLEQFEVEDEERQRLLDEGEVGQYPGDDTLMPRIERSGRKEFDQLKSKRLDLTGQVKQARQREKELHPYPKIERFADTVLGHVPGFLSPDVPKAAQVSPKPPSTSAPVRPSAPSRFEVEEGEIIDTKNRQIIAPHELNRLSTPQEKDEVASKLQAGGYLMDEPAVPGLIKKPTPAPTSIEDTPVELEIPEIHVIGERPQQPHGPRSILNEFVDDVKQFASDLRSAPSPKSLGEAVTESAHNFLQGIAGIPAGALKSIAIASKSLDDLVPNALKDDRPIEERATYKLGQSIDKLAKQLFPANPELQKNFVVGVVPRALGSMTGFLGGAAVGAIAKAPLTTGGMLGAQVGGAEQYEDATKHGASDEVKQKAFWLGSAVGVSEIAPVGALLNRFNKATGGGFFKVLKEGGVTAAQEFVQEYFQQTGNNIIAQQLYDENRSWLGGTLESGSAGGVSGGITGLLSGILQGRKARKQQRMQEGGASETPFAGEPTPPPQPSTPDLVAGIPDSLTVVQKPPFLVKKFPSPMRPAPEIVPGMQAAEPMAPPVQPAPLPTAPAPAMEPPPIVPIPQATAAPEPLPGAVLSEPAPIPVEAMEPTAPEQITVETASEEIAPDIAPSIAPDSAEVAPTPEGALEAQAHEAATSPMNDLPEPTEAMKQAGNYKLGHTRIAGLDISIENPQGSVRSGVDPDGKAWEQEMTQHYGYIRGVPKGKDGDHLDVFVKPTTPQDYSGDVFVVDQVDPKTGKFDETKTLIGFKTIDEARQAYLGNYRDDWNGLGNITKADMDAFKQWLQSGKTTKPFSSTPAAQWLKPVQQVVPTPEQAVQQPAPSKAARKPEALQPQAPKRDERGNPEFDYSNQPKRPTVKQIIGDWKQAGRPKSFTARYGETFARFNFEELHGIPQWWDEGNGARRIDRNKVLDALKAEQFEGPDTATPPTPELASTALPTQGPNKAQDTPTPERVSTDSPSRQPAGPTPEEVANPNTGLSQPDNSREPKAEPSPTPEAVTLPKEPEKPTRPAKKKLTVKQMAAKRRSYFTPGNIVEGYGGTKDVVVAYHPGDSLHSWSVDVRELLPSGKMGPVRNHFTQPSLKEMEQFEANPKRMALEPDKKSVGVPSRQQEPTPDEVTNPQVQQPRSELPPKENAEMLLRAEKGQADLEIAGKETGRRKVFNYDIQGQGGTPDVISLKSAAPAWYTELTTGPRPLKRAQIETAIQKIIKDEGSDVGKAVERVKEALLHDREFNKTPWGEDADAIARGEWPSWIEKPGAMEPPTPDRLETPKAKKGKPEQTSIPVPPPTIGERPIIGREATPEEAPLFSKSAQTPDAEQTTLPEAPTPEAVTAPNISDAAPGTITTIEAAGKGETVSAAPVKQAQQEQKQDNAVSRLREMADSLEEKADESLNADRKTNTAKRARQASHADNEAYKSKALAGTMRNLADAIESGEATHLSGLRTKAQVEMLDSMLERAKYDRIKQETKGSYVDYERQKDRKAEPEDATFASYPELAGSKSELFSAYKDLATIKGADRLRNRFYKQAESLSEGQRVKLPREDVELAIEKYPRKSGIPWHWPETLAKLKRLESMGITSLPELRAALREFVEYRGKRGMIDKAKQLERGLIGNKGIGNDFFPTPKETAQRMVAEAGIEPGMKVLEPSAGNGNIAEVIRAAGVSPDVVEQSPRLREILEAKGFNVVEQDFMDVKDGGYDRIVMNPPFSNGQDAEHIQHAYTLLKPGGKLVAIAGEGVFFRSDAKATAFRTWLDEVGGTSEKLPEGTFNDSSLMATTGVNARMVVLEKPSNESIKELGQSERASAPQGRDRSPAKELADLFKQEAEQAKKSKRPIRPRIPIAPLTGGPSVTLSDILLDLSKGIGKKVTFGKVKRGQAGVYKPGSTATVVKYSGDLDTTAHELAGHFLDDKYGMGAAWKNQATSPFDAELSLFAPHGSTTAQSSATYDRAEGVAEYMRAWLVNPDAAEAAAPLFTAHMKATLPKDIQSALKTFSTQIRQWAGNSAHAKIMANVQWETPDSGLLHWLTKGKNAKGPGFQLTFGDQLATAMTDRLAPFMKAIKYAKDQRGIDQLLPGEDPALLARLHMGINAKLDDIFTHGMVNSRLERATPGGIQWMMEPLDRSSAKALEADMQEAASLMIAQRTIEKASQLGKKRVSGIGAGIEDDVAVAEARLTELKRDPARYERMREAASRYRQWADANLRYLVDKGRLSEEQYEAIKANNEQYVAMQRILDVAPGEELAVTAPRGAGGGKLGSSGQPVQEFKGSTRAIKNPYLSLMDATAHSVREADRNEVLKLFRDMLTTDRGMYEGDPQDTSSVGRQAKAGEKHTIPIFVNGAKEIWQFHPDIYKALKGVEEGAYKLPWVMTVLPRILRATIVNMPPFALRNIIRDAWHRSIISLNGSKPWDTLKRYSKEEVEQLKKAGGDQAGHYYSDAKNYARAMQFAMEEAVLSTNSIVVNPAKLGMLAKKGGQAYLDLMQGSERQGRLAEYRRAFRKAQEEFGYDDYHAMLYAASQSRSLIDYAVAGNWMLIANQLIPFSNAAVQGLRSSALRAKADPSGYALRFGAFALVPTLMTLAWNFMFDDDLDEYRQKSAYDRDLFWSFKFGPDLWLKIPKPFEAGVLASSFERAVDYGMGNEKAFDGHVGAFLRTLLPVDEASLAGPYQAFVQAMVNYDFFRDRAIVPRWEENLDLDLRSYNRASRLGQALQEAIGVDARKIDFVIQQQFGYLGRYAADLSDIGRKDRHGMTISATGLVSPSPSAHSIDAKWVTDKAEDRGVAPSHAKAVERIRHVKDVPATASKNPDALRYGVFRHHLNQYHKAESNEERDRLAKLVRDEAKYLRERWEKTPPRKDAAEKAGKKRATETEDPFLEAMGLIDRPLSKHPVHSLPGLVP